VEIENKFISFPVLFVFFFFVLFFQKKNRVTEFAFHTANTNPNYNPISISIGIAYLALTLSLTDLIRQSIKSSENQAPQEYHE
jgi:hypothetical protein